MATANEADFFGEGTVQQPGAPRPRATTPDGLYYLDDGSPTPLLLSRQRALSGNRQDRQYLAETDKSWTPAQAKDPSQYKMDPATGTYYSEGSDGRRTYITNDPAAEFDAQQQPIFTANFGAAQGGGGDPLKAVQGGVIGASVGGPAGAAIGAGAGALAGLPQASGRGIYLTEGSGEVPGRQGTPAEAAAANAQYGATGSSQGWDTSMFAPGAGGTTRAGGGFGGAPPPERNIDDYMGMGKPPRTDAVDAQIRQFLAQEQSRQGQPSEAEALMLKSRDQLFGQAMGLAAGARGGAAARERAERQASAGNVALGARVTQEVAALRAREEAERRDRVGRILDMLSANAGRGDVTDLGYGQLGAELYGTDTRRDTEMYNIGERSDTARYVADRGLEGDQAIAQMGIDERARIRAENQPSTWDRLAGLADWGVKNDVDDWFK
jgi:hypothetical protein